MLASSSLSCRNAQVQKVIALFAFTLIVVSLMIVSYQQLQLPFTLSVPIEQNLVESVSERQHDHLPHYNRRGYIQARKHVVFTLYGDRPMDLVGALFNAKSIPLYYLSWKTLFVVDRTVPEESLQKLRDAGADIHIVSELQSHWGDARRIFRYLALNDSSIDYFMFRDTDSRVSAREISSVNTWLQSNKSYHIMRDHPNHVEVMLGGMWGVYAPTLRQKIGDISSSINNYIQSKGPDFKKFHDQWWLEKFVYPQIEDDVIEHDAWKAIKSSNRSTPFPLPRDYHGDYVGHILDPAASYNIDHVTALWPEYRKNGQNNFQQGEVPVEYKIEPECIYG